MTPELELSAARMDVQCSSNILFYAIKDLYRAARMPVEAHPMHAYYAVCDQAAEGCKWASRKIAKFHEAASYYEGSRVALAELVEPSADESRDPLDDAMCVTGDEAKALRKAMAAAAEQS